MTPEEDLAARIAAGRTHRVAGELDAAVEAFTAAAAAFPAAARPLLERGAVRILQGRPADALADHEAARRLEPDAPGLESCLAEDLLFLGRGHEALAAARRGQRAEPDALMHRVNLAHALLLLGRSGLAEHEYAALRDVAHPTKGLSGGEIALEDLRALRAAGVVGGPDADAVEALLR